MTITCEICGRTFIDDRQPSKVPKTCGPECANVKRGRKIAAGHARRREIPNGWMPTLEQLRAHAEQIKTENRRKYIA